MDVRATMESPSGVQTVEAPAPTLCVDCGARMHEQYRLKENGCVFVWLVCNGPNCTGQMLRKLPAR